MYKTKKYIKNNIMIILLVTIVIVTNIVIIYTSLSLYNKEGKLNVVKIIETTPKSPLVVEIIDENEPVKENENIEIIKEINTEINNEENKYKKGKAKYYIKVNCEAQTVNVYEKDENNMYSKPVKVMLCSTGIHTPESGTYKITNFKRKWLALQGNVYGQYCTQIVGNILFHSVPYLEKGNNASLKYEEYDKLGQDASLGCIRLTVENAKWIFDNCEAGTMVEFYSSSNPGPLGKPDEIKLSEYAEDLKKWDPTDTDKNNPWIEYKNILKQKEDEKQKYYNAAIDATMQIINLI